MQDPSADLDATAPSNDSNELVKPAAHTLAAQNTPWQRAVLLTQKELRETLRDRRTILTLLAMPILMYPLLGLTFRMLAVNQLTQNQAGPRFSVALKTDVEAHWLKATLELGENLLTTRKNSDRKRAAENRPFPSEPSLDAPDATNSGPPAEITPAETNTAEAADADTDPQLFRIVVPDEEQTFDLESSVATAESDLGVQVELSEWNGQLETLQPARVTVFVNENSVNSRDAQRLLEERLQAANLLFLLQVARTYAPETRLLVQIQQREIASTEKTRGFLGLLPLVLMLMTVTGGVYPAIDLTAGERERETLETLIALPIPTVHLLLAKYVAVFSVTMLTGLINLIAMAATVYALQMETHLFGTDGIHPGLALALVSIQIVFGLFYSAVLLAITSSSRSFKEAQAYLIPLMLMSIAPGLSILLPGWHLQGMIAVVPLVNMLLLARDLFEGNAMILPAIAAVVSTLIYAAGALVLAAQVFGRDAIAVGSRGSWGELLRRPNQTAADLSLMPAVLTLAMMFPLYFFARGLLIRMSGAFTPERHLLSSATMSVILFMLIPAAVIIWQRCRLSSALQIRNPRVSVWPFVILLGVGTWPWVYELVMATQQLGFARIEPERLQQIHEILERWRSVPLWWMVMCLGIVPGLSEEFFFRGFLLGALRQSLRPAPAILICGTVFGVFHVIAADGATVERLLPSTALGCLLSWIAIRTNSVLPGMIMHSLHNSSLLILAHYRDELSNLALGDVQQEHLPTTWLITSAVIITVGIIALSLIRPAPGQTSVVATDQNPGRI